MPRKGQSARKSRTKEQYQHMEASGWRRHSDADVQLRRQQRFRLKAKVRSGDPRFQMKVEEVQDLVTVYLKRKKVTKCPPGFALGAHRDGVEILSQ